MSGVFTSSPTRSSFFTLQHPTTQTHSRACYPLASRGFRVSCLSTPNLRTHSGLKFGACRHRNTFRCNSVTGPGSPGSGDDENKAVLDAFFLGKALAEAVNERIESTVGELLSTLGRLQAEQQRQLQDFQEDVLERAKKAKERAAREAMEAQGLVPMPTNVDSTPTTNGAPRAASPPSTTVNTYSSHDQIATPSVNGPDTEEPSNDE